MFDAVSAVALNAAVEGQLAERELALPAIAFGLIAASSFAVLLAITYSFRAVAHRR